MFLESYVFQVSKLSSSSVDVSEEDKPWSPSIGDSGLPSSGRSSRGLDDCDSPVNSPETRIGSCGVAGFKYENLESIRRDLPCDIGLDDSITPLEVIRDNKQPFQKTNGDSDSNFIRLRADFNTGSSTREQSTDSFSRLYENSDHNEDSMSPDSSATSDNHVPSELDDIFKLEESKFETKTRLEVFSPSEHTEPLGLDRTNSNLQIIAVNNLPLTTDQSTLVSIPLRSLASEMADVVEEEMRGVVDTHTTATPLSAPVQVIKSLDKVIESLEKIMEPLEVIAESDLQLTAASRLQSDKVSNTPQFIDYHRLKNTIDSPSISVPPDSVRRRSCSI